MNRGHVPIRQCIGCRIRRPKNEMIRLKADGKAIIVSYGKTQGEGRGCYLCPLEKCVEAALKKGNIQRALHVPDAASPTKAELLRRLEKKGIIEIRKEHNQYIYIPTDVILHRVAEAPSLETGAERNLRVGRDNGV